MMRKNLVPIVLAGLLVLTCAMTRPRNKSEKVVADVVFARIIASEEQFAIELGKLAQSNALRSSIRDLGKVMMEQNAKLRDQFAPLAEANGIVVPPGLSEEQRLEYERLANLTGYEFDIEFTRSLVRTNRELLSQFKAEAKKGEKSQVKEWAAKRIFTVGDLLHISKVCYKLSKREM